MKTMFRSLSVRLVASFLLIVAVAVGSTAVLSRSLAGGFFEDHLEDMARDPSMGMTSDGQVTDEMLDTLRDGFSSSFARAELVAILVSASAAVAISALAAHRLLRPIGRFRKVTTRMARGAYSERVAIPVETELAALAEDVNSLGSALADVEERRVRLISEVAHELRAPLSTIQGYMEGLLDGVFEPSEAIYASTAHEAARLKRLANDLSTLAAAESRAIEIKSDEIDLGEIASEAAERLRPQFEAQDVELLVGTMPALRTRGDSDRLAQVFVNIVGNALSYTQAGGRVTLGGERVGGRVCVYVADTGRGMTDEQIGLVFERFYRADRHGRRGTGIGLTIARRIARFHGGDVTAQSPGLGRGSTFSVCLPLA